jgi:aerobic carbon-monoxide dehydrogenase medium subunit
VIPQEFTYERPETVEDAVAALQRHGDDAQVLAGGHSLIPMMKLRLAAPEVVVDIGRISSLRGIRETPDGLAIGALTRHADVASSDVVRRTCPVLADAAGGIGDRQVRARGTIGGALAHADPHGDLPAVLLALGGSVEAQGPNGTRTIAADDLFVDYLTTSLEPDEILTSVLVPAATRGAYVKFNRRAQDWAIVGVCAVIHGASARIGVTGVGSRPMRATAAEQAFTGSNAAEAAALAAEGLSPDTDVAGSAEYRLHLVKVLTERALEEAASAVHE